VDDLLRIGLMNAAWALVLALVAALVAWKWPRQSTLIHGLWLLVLVKLITPPLVYIPWPAGFQGSEVDRGVVRAGSDETRNVQIPSQKAMVVRPSSAPIDLEPQPLTEPKPRAKPQWRLIVIGLWVSGAAVWWLVQVRQTSRFRRLLRSTRPASPALLARAKRVAELLGLRRCPDLEMVPARVPPMVWALFSTPRLLLPEDLWDRLGPEHQDLVLAHELAHLKRRDHWVRRFEAVVLGIFWWDPIAWWALREVERAEERCCDDWVAWAFPKSAHEYADVLVTTAAFLSGSRVPWPAGASGAGRAPLIKERLNMILQHATKAAPARPASRIPVMLGALTLLLLPAFGAGGSSQATLQDKPNSTEVTTRPARDDIHILPRSVVDKTTASDPAQDDPATPKEDSQKRDTEKRVRISRPIVREVAEYQDFVGRIEPFQSVELRARVSGILVKSLVDAGLPVKKGQLLFEIDPRPYQAGLDKAEAEVQRSSSRAKRLATESARAKQQLDAGRIKAQEYDQIEADRSEAEATLATMQASLELAKLQLEFTRVTAPIDGMIHGPVLEPGNVAVADQTVLGKMASTNPMYVFFNMDERTFLRLSRVRQEGKLKKQFESGFPIEVGLADEPDDFSIRGKVMIQGGNSDPKTGTVRLRATLPNTDGILVPGLFARVRVATGFPHIATLVPTASVQLVRSASQWPTVMVVDKLGFLRMRRVKLGSIHGDLREVREGLQDDDWVVVDHRTALEQSLGLHVTTEKVEIPLPEPKDASRSGEPEPR
jgi:RND family efflux transporter MFP subunit